MYVLFVSLLLPKAEINKVAASSVTDCVNWVYDIILYWSQAPESNHIVVQRINMYIINIMIKLVIYTPIRCSY